MHKKSISSKFNSIRNLHNSYDDDFFHSLSFFHFFFFISLSPLFEYFCFYAPWKISLFNLLFGKSYQFNRIHCWPSLNRLQIVSNLSIFQHKNIYLLHINTDYCERIINWELFSSCIAFNFVSFQKIILSMNNNLFAQTLLLFFFFIFIFNRVNYWINNSNDFSHLNFKMFCCLRNCSIAQTIKVIFYWIVLLST